MADLGLYEFVVTDGVRVGWFLLEQDEAHASGGIVAQLDPELEGLGFADLCGLVCSVTGMPPEGKRGW